MSQHISCNILIFRLLRNFTVGRFWEFTPDKVSFQQMTEYSLYSESPCTLRNWLRTNRQARHLTLRTVAARLGVSHTWVSKVENGERRLDVFEYVNLCFALGLNPRAGLDLIITARSPYEQSGDAYPQAAEKKPAYGRKKPR